MLKLLPWLTMVFCGSLFAAQHQMIDTLGSSPKGQFIAVEEYGYKSDKHSYYVTIRIMNIWKEEYVGTPVEVELPAVRKNYLQKARDKARTMAEGELRRYNIM